ncbi:MAG: DNA polymerase IV, partial [Lachnospiraceae bacterium]|nr:DNA polymerase IV [Lachnospiraceae bacterium]
MEKIIFHIDVNSAFLSWSAVKRLKEDPSAQDIRLIPSIVGGDVKTRHGIVTAKSIPAKKYGIKTGEPVVKALQKCPELVIVRSDFDTYREYSRAFITILRKYSAKVEQASIDEAFLDMTDVLGSRPDPRGAAQETAGRIREEISGTLGFTVNVGISTNKLLAKMASDFTKPDRTHTLYPEEIPEKMWPLPIGDLYGCGAKTADKLRTLGVLTIGDAAALPEEVLRSYLGEKTGEYISLSSNGKGSDTVHTDRDDAKSYSNEITTPYD